MAITIRRAKHQKGVPLKSLDLGNTFLYDNRVCVIVEHSGSLYPLDLTTCRGLGDGYPFTKRLDPDTIVVPIDVEIVYEVAG